MPNGQKKNEKKYANKTEANRARRQRKKQKKNQKQQQKPNVQQQKGTKNLRSKTAIVQGRVINKLTQTNDPKYNLAQGDRANIMVLAPVEALAVQAMPLALMSNAIAMGADNPTVAPLFWAYYAFMQDLLAILTNKVSQVSSRLSYLNAILASYLPKTIPFKTGTLSFSWIGVDSVIVSSSISIRGYSYYMYVTNGGTQAGGWPTMGAPAAPANLDEAVPILSAMNSVLANDRVPHLKYVTNIEFTAHYKADTSAFAAISPYYGGGNAPSSGSFSSMELEVPFKSIVLPGLTSFDENNGRVGRKFNLTSGDSTCALGLGFLPGMAMTVYNTKYPIQYCYLDLDEVVVWLQSWYMSLVSQVSKDMNNFDNTVTDAFLPFGFTKQQFRIAVSRCVLNMFSYSQSMAQFMTYSQNNNGFEPFRMGFNTAGKPRYSMMMPEMLVENLRMLLPKFLEVPTKFENKKNQLVVVPVWGIYKNTEDEPYNLVGPLWDGTSLVDQFLFIEDITNDPNPIDGTDILGNVCDLNCNIISNLIEEWNQRVNLMKQASLPCTFLAGNSYGNLLLYTRFVEYQEIDVKLNCVSKYMQRHLPRNYIKTKKIERTISKGKLVTPMIKEDVEDFYIPAAGSLFTQATLSMSSIPAITEQIKALFNYLIFPTIVLEPNSPPTQKQVRVGMTQSHLLTWDRAINAFVSTRGNKLQELGKLCAPGTAANHNDEFANIVSTFANESKGGFIGDILGSLARELPI